ncbi:CxxxxCH/CxxCH domain-containing protein [Candidatus Desantisbacteria bacterium]|nr:CxxxxCH/CxxCH domain-containing protein [Candidatus Desantisbacteria bacterium]
MKNLKLIYIFFISLLFLSLFSGCSKRNKESIFNHDTGKHLKNWISEHKYSYLKDKDSCDECHENNSSGGISKLGCFSKSFNGAICHPDGTFGHPSDWKNPLIHGASAKSAPGFKNCKECHGNDFSGGITNTSCFTCHGVNAPHPKKNWNGDILTHTNTDAANSSICFDCHANGNNSDRKPDSTASKDTLPGCFNNTLCHAIIGHFAGWESGNNHGVTAEKDFSVCKNCHGADFKGGISTISCYSCHTGPGVTHPDTGWIIPNHKINALTDIILCKKCHGDDYLGGSSQIACNICHMENETKVHILNWYPDVQLNHRSYAKNNGTLICTNVNCHGIELTGVNGSGPSCSTCHTWPFVSVHPSDWNLGTNHGVTAEKDFSVCKNCHGSNLSGITGSGISCSTCHPWPFTLSNCNTCHNSPPSGYTYPDIAGSHTIHTALVNINCTSCHTNSGSGTINHINNIINVIFNNTFNAKSGISSYSSQNKTCSKISCHGGTITPNWISGNIDVNTQCSSCHKSGTGEYNGYSSGRHSLHTGFASCTECHDINKLPASHFTNLNTSAMTGANLTIISAANYTGGRCTITCHGKNHNNNRW